MSEFLHSAGDIIVFIAGICSALLIITNFLKKPADAVKHKTDENQQKHDDELTQAITESIMDQVEPLIKEVKDINLAQNDQIGKLEKGQLDLLRQQIIYLYNHHSAKQTLTSDERKFLEDLYKDYAAEGGNGYIKALYDKMDQWNITP